MAKKKRPKKRPTPLAWRAPQDIRDRLASIGDGRPQSYHLEAALRSYLEGLPAPMGAA